MRRHQACTKTAGAAVVRLHIPGCHARALLVWQRACSLFVRERCCQTQGERVPGSLRWSPVRASRHGRELRVPSGRCISCHLWVIDPPRCLRWTARLAAAERQPNGNQNAKSKKANPGGLA